MKNDDIHNGLDKKEIRDYLSKTLHKEFMEGYSDSVEYFEKQIKELEAMLEHAKIVRAIIQLIELNGWSEFDVSGLIKWNKETYFSFVGTEKEYEKLVKKIKKENENES